MRSLAQRPPNYLASVHQTVRRCSDLRLAGSGKTTFLASLETRRSYDAADRTSPAHQQSTHAQDCGAVRMEHAMCVPLAMETDYRGIWNPVPG